MKSSLKMQQLESKIADLKSQQQKLIQQRNTEIAELISRINLQSADNKTLVGGLLYIAETITSKSSQSITQTEAWKESGGKFLRTRKAKEPNHSKEAE